MIMNGKKGMFRCLFLAVLACLAALPAAAQSFIVQCPTTTLAHPSGGSGIKCVHLSGGDGYATMADATDPTYIFGFSNLGVGTTSPADITSKGAVGAKIPAPLISIDEDDELFLTLSNVAMSQRPDLFDGHSVHFHGYPNASSFFDGVPDASIAVIPGASITYYYAAPEAGTYIYHCHVEAPEHMQMGMLGQIYVRPRQNRLSNNTPLGSHTHLTGHKYAYNDGDGTTRYDVEFPIQMSGMDPDFHTANLNFQPLPFAPMRDRHFLLNGRSYPETLTTGEICTADANNTNGCSQQMNSIITANAGQKILLRISNLSITNFSTLATLGIPMKVVGIDARLLRDAAGTNLSYTTNSITIGGGQTVDVILDTTGFSAGTYYLYNTNLNQLANDATNFGGMMTEIRIN